MRSATSPAVAARPPGEAGEQLSPPLLVAEGHPGALAEHRLHPAGVDRARVHRDDPHPVVEAPSAERAGQGHEARVAARTRDVVEVRVLARVPDVVHDDPVAALAHAAEERPAHRDVAEDLELPAGAPCRVVHRIHRAGGDRPRVVDEDVDVDRLRDEPVARHAVREVERVGADPAAVRPLDRTRRLVERAAGAGRKMDLARAFAGERLGRRAADSLRAAGDQHALAVQSKFHRRLLRGFR